LKQMGMALATMLFSLLLVSCSAKPVAKSADPPPVTLAPSVTPAPPVTPTPSAPATKPEALLLGPILVYSPPSSFTLNKELSLATRSIWADPKTGWVISADVEPWTTSERSITAVAPPPSADPSARKELIIKGDHEEYFGLLTSGADGTGGEAARYWQLVVGGSKGILRLGCSGTKDYEALKVLCNDEIAKLRVTDLGTVVKP
jgi:hypothetical protein